jgi:microcystin-dependent protein
MPIIERLYQFTAKSTLATDDIIFCGNTSDSYNEVQTTVAGLIGAYPALLSIASLTVAADQIIYTTATDTFATSGISSFGLLAINLTAATDKIFSTDGAGNPQLSSTVPAFTLGGTLNTNGQTITNSLTNGDVNVLTNGSGLWVLNGSTGLTGFIDDSSFATASATKGATSSSIKAYVDSVAGSGFSVILACLLATTANLSGTYNNGASGVGATLTNNTTQAALEIDGVTVQVADRILVKDQTATADNGVYVVTTVGDGSTDWVLTRATDYDTAAEVLPGTLIPVSSGDTNGGSIWLETATVTTMGTDPIIFSIYAQPANTFVTLATTQTVSGAKTFSNDVTLSGGSFLDLNGGTAIDGFIDDSSFATASATKGATSSSIKAYVDAMGGGSNPIGTISAFAMATPPSGYLECDGSAVSRATYSDLFTAIGTTWGVGDGSTTFNLPNMQRSVAVGSGGTGTSTLGNSVGDTGGEEDHTITTGELPGNTINYSTATLTNHIGSNTGAAGYLPALNAAVWNSNGGGAANVIQPSAVVLMCIKAEPDASATASAASQAEMETASSTTVYTSPGRQQFHPGHPKAWVLFDGTGTPSITESYNVTSITDNGTGDYTVTFTTPFSSINYCAVGTCGFGVNVTYTSATCPYVAGPQAAPTVSTWRFGTGQGAVGSQPGVRVDLGYISLAFLGGQ